MLLLPVSAAGNTYYCAPTGNDTNPGTLQLPWFTLNRAWTELQAGDTLFLKGGTYYFHSMQYLDGPNGSAGLPVCIWAVPGEKPVITRSSIYNVYDSNNIDLIYFEGAYFHWKGIEIANHTQLAGAIPYSAFRAMNSNHCIFEGLNYHHNASAFKVSGNSGNNLILNCDFHHNQDPYGGDGAGTDAYDGADGLNVSFIPGNNASTTIRGCRAWFNSDDGFDFWEDNSLVIIEDCWSWYNGYIPGTFTEAGNGNGFKLGQISQSAAHNLKRIVRNNISFHNRLLGFNEANLLANAHIYNNISSGEGLYGFWFDYGLDSLYASYTFFIRNNISFNNPQDLINDYAVVQKNSWQNGLTASAADFISLDSTQLENQRQLSGALPEISLFHLAAGSDLIDSGVIAGIPYFGSLPDLGPFEVPGTAPPPGVSPIADAGADQQIIQPPNRALLNANGSADPDGIIDLYQWRIVSGPPFGIIHHPYSASDSITDLAVGTYLLELTVTDNTGATDTDTLQLVVLPITSNIPPVANAGNDQVLNFPVNNFQLDGSLSTDPDGSISSFSWTKISGPDAVIINTPDSSSTSLSVNSAGTYEIQLAVLDNFGAIDLDTVQVVVNPAPPVSPIANAGFDIAFSLPQNQTTLDGSASYDPDGVIVIYSWVQLTGPPALIQNSASGTTTAINLTEAQYLFELTVTDNSGLSSKDTLLVNVYAAPNIPPVAVAGNNQSITLPVSNTIIDGSGSYDPNGIITRFSWVKISGPDAGTISNPDSSVTAVSGLIPGLYAFELTVTDNNGDINSDTVQLLVNPALNLPPISNAGSDQQITLPVNTVTLNGTSSIDPDGTIATYLWTKIAGPAAGTISNPASASTSVTGLTAGVYSFELKVTDDSSAVDRDTMTITVYPPLNTLPVANAGSDQQITLPVNTATLNGTSSIDPDGTITTYIWTKIAGPTAGSISNPASASTSVTGLTAGVYSFELTVTDDSSAVDKDTVVITVYPPLNTPPVANAGPDQSVTLPVNTTTLNGTGSFDSDGTITTYAWTKISGPAAGTISNSTSVTTTVTGLTQGAYLFELTVTDDSSAVDKDTVVITVYPPLNTPPVANAGSDQQITLPVNTVLLIGTGSQDPDGTITGYTWTKIAGPAAGTISNPASASTSVTGLTAGVYSFELKVTDDSSAVDRDTMTITVYPPLNTLPVANAGSDQQITLPVNTVLLNGTGSQDPDGTITGYSWTKIAGPAAGTISNPASASTSVTGLTAGVYSFELIVTDDSSAIDKDTVVITVFPPLNTLPVANAGPDQNITLPVNTVTLNGTNSIDPDGTITTYLWTKIAGPTAGSISNPASASTSVTGLTAGVYSFELTVTDDSSAIDKDTVVITVYPPLNTPPVANAGPDQSITLPANSVVLNGTGSQDPDGTITEYTWTKIAGPAAGTISNPASASTSVTGLTAGVYSFELTVTDDSSAIDKDTVVITVYPPLNTPPVANAGPDQSITLPANSVVLNGTGSQDPDGTITEYTWTKIAGPAAGSISNPASASTSVTGLTAGVYSFELTVTDDSSAVDRDTMTITVYPPLNTPPVANAGPDQSVTLPSNSVLLNGTGSQDPDGTITGYTWTKIAGPAAGTISNPASTSTTVTGLTQGAYLFELTITDDSSAVDKDTVVITVYPPLNTPPVANAGPDQSITLPVNTTTLNGTGSFDSDGTITAYTWTKIAGPAAGTISNPASASTSVTGLTAGVYSFELIVTDDSSAIDKDTVVITVFPPLNTLPVANAGPDQSITLPVNTVLLNGTGSQDPDGTITGYTWTKIAGPTAGTIINPASATTAVTGLTQGAYLFELTITDDSSAVDKDTVVITVYPPLNTPPVANAGPDQNITLPVNTATLNGTSSIDQDGTIMTYLWTKIAGPAAGTISNSTSATTTVTGLTAGIYSFELKVTDDSSAADKDTVVITVYPPLNTPPVANAGTDQSITLPVNTVSLNGTGSFDSDGTITTYAWTKISGPAAGTISNSTSVTTTVTGLTQGAYLFELTVTDDSSAVDKDTVVITVYPPLNTPPVANAGPDQSITLPVNTVFLNGTGSQDPDGMITGYTWTKIAGPAVGTISNPASASTTVTGLTQGAYLFELTITDDSSAVDKDTIAVTVLPVPNSPPVSLAGNDLTITLPSNSFILNGSASFDPDGTITSYAWRKISGPAAGIISTPDQPVSAVSSLTAGNYLFELTVTDNNSATARDTVSATVLPAPNQLPVARAGLDISITLPANIVTVDGSHSSDPDGLLISYSWSQIAGPAVAAIQNPTGIRSDIIFSNKGIYLFELTVTDNALATSMDTIQVTILPAPNQPPRAIAESDQIIYLPVDSILLSGRGTDPDGVISSYQWRKIAGPASFVLEHPDAAITQVKNLKAGIYQFELTVTDNLGLSAKDSLFIEIKPAEKRSVRIYPNPVSSLLVLNINATSLSSHTQIVIRNTSGYVVYKEELKRDQPSISHQIDLSRFPAGYYLLEIIEDSQKMEVLKLIKQQ